MMYYENYPKSLEESTNLTFTILCDYLLQKLNDTASPSSAVVDGDEVETNPNNNNNNNNRIISIKELLNATTHEIISRPPFSYLYEFIRVVFSSSSLVINITTCPETKTEKIRFLTRVISYLSLYDIKKEVKEGVPLNVLVSPVQIICGQNVMATHLFLRQLIQTKQKEKDHDSDIIHYINQIGESHLYRKNVRIRNTFVRIQAIVRGWTFRKRKEISYLDHTSPCNSGSREDRSLSENNNNNNISSITKRIRHNNQMLNQSLIELTNSTLLFSSPSPRRHTTTSCNGVDNGTDNIIHNHNINNNNNNIQHFLQSKSKSSPSLKSSSFHLTERTTSYNKNNKEKEMKLKILHDKYKQRLFTMKQQKESIQQEKLELEKQKEKVVLLANQLRKRQHSNIIKRRRESRQSKSQSELKHDIKKDNKDKKNNNNNKTTWVMLREEQNKQNQLLNQSKIPKPSSTHTTTHSIEKRELKLKQKKKIVY